MKLVLLILIIMACGCAPAKQTIKEAEKNIISIAVGGRVDFCPHNVQTESARQGMGFVYEPLYYVSYDGNIIPALAKEITVEGRYAEILLKENVIWHDGTFLTGEDVAYTINLVAGGESCYKEPLIKNATVNNFGSIRVEFDIPLKKPELHLTFPIIKTGSFNTGAEPMGTGPFCFDKRLSFDTFSFIPFGQYHGTVPENIELEIIWGGEEEAEYSLFQAGQTDGLYIKHHKLSSFIRGETTEVDLFPTNHIVLVGLNCTSLPDAVRRAIYMAVDTQTLGEEAFGYGVRVLNRSTSPNMFLAHDEMKSAGFTLKSGKYCRISIDVQDDPQYITFASQVCKSLEDFGIECEVHISQAALDDFKKGAYDMVLGEMEIKSEFYELVEPGNMLFYENSYLQNLMRCGADEIEIKNIIRRQVPFIPVAVLCDGVAVRKLCSGECTPVYSFAYRGMMNGGNR